MFRSSLEAYNGMCLQSNVIQNSRLNWWVLGPVVFNIIIFFIIFTLHNLISVPLLIPHYSNIPLIFNNPNYSSFNIITSTKTLFYLFGGYIYTYIVLFELYRFLNLSFYFPFHWFYLSKRFFLISTLSRRIFVCQKCRVN